MHDPRLAARTHDPLAVAIANASLLSAGYVMLGRRKLAAVTLLITFVLAIVLISVAPTVWFEAVLFLWWAALVAHGWFLAGGSAQLVEVRRERQIALGIAVPALLVLVLLRLDAFSIDQSVSAARENGDCLQASTTLDRVGLGDQVANAALIARGEETRQACQQLQAAEIKLGDGLETGNRTSLSVGFDGLRSVLQDRPGHDRMVATALDGFIHRLPTEDPCHASEVTDWLRDYKAGDSALDRVSSVVPQVAPTALIECGDELMAASNWTQARPRYQQVLDQYPGHVLTAKAQDGVKGATLAIELENVRRLLEGGGDYQPDYCSTPAPYSAAAPYHHGSGHALIYGNDTYAAKLPGGWRATDVTNAILIVCLGDAEDGPAVRTCPYENKLAANFPVEVTFHRIAIPVKAYELRTGKLVINT
jgi:hypothetical protein